MSNENATNKTFQTFFDSKKHKRDNVSNKSITDKAS